MARPFYIGFTLRSKRLTIAIDMKSKLFKPGLLTLHVVILASVAIAKNPHSRQKEILHLFSQTQMTNAGILPDATGSVFIHVNAQSKGKPQDIRLQVRNLEANATYELSAFLANDTNFTPVVSFTSDDHGNAKLEFRDKLAGPPGKHPVPAPLSPISNVRELAILDATNQIILDVDLSHPNKFEYLLKRDFSTNSVDALLQINGNTHGARLRVTASGLDANSQYSLGLNGGIVASENTDAHGRLHIAFQLDQPTDLFTLQTIDLLDASTNVVDSTSLP